MAKLKKTLPKNFRELIVNEDWETLKAELKKCEPNAYERGGIAHILYARVGNYQVEKYLSLEMIEWIVKENNADVDFYEDEYKQRPLLSYIDWHQYEIVKKLLELGANPNEANTLISNSSPLDKAVLNFQPEIYRLLLEYGAHPDYNTGHPSKPVHSLLEKIIISNGRMNPFMEKFILTRGDGLLEMLRLSIEYSAIINDPATIKRLQLIYDQFYQNYANHYFSSYEVEEKMEQFELKLYELMQFEPQ